MIQSAVILAGGMGTRLMPLTRDLPKPMVPVAGQPFLTWQLQYLEQQGVNDVLLLVSYLGDKIIEHYTKNPIRGLKIRFATEPTPLGTGGAVRLALKQLPDSFWLLNGDSFLALDLKKFAQFIDSNNLSYAMAVADPKQFAVPGNVQAAGSLISEYKKSATSADRFEFVDAGFYALKREIFESFNEGVFDLGEVWPPLIKAKKLGAYKIQDRYFDIGTHERLNIFAENIHHYVDLGRKK